MHEVKAEMKIVEDVTIQDTFLVDSGSGDAVDHPVAKTMESKQETTSGVGLGTPVNGYLGKLSGFKLGAFSFRNVPVSCCGGTEPTSRLIGGEILHRLTLTFDYAHKRIFLEPNRYFRSHF